MTEVEAQKLVTVIAANYALHLSRLPERAQLEWQDVFRTMLLDLDYLAANMAVKTLLATQKFLPSVSEVRELALNPSASITTGGDAWGAVRKAIDKSGHTRTPGIDFFFRDPLTARCVDALGWQNLCNSEMAQSDRARFIEMYEDLKDHHRVTALSEGLPDVKRFREAEAAKAAETLPQRRGAAVSLGALLQFALPEPDKEKP